MPLAPPVAGSGTFTSVFEAYDARTKGKVAVKVLNKVLDSEASVLDKEAECLKR